MKLQLTIEVDPDVELSAASVRLETDLTGGDTVNLVLVALQQYVATAQEAELASLLPQLPEELTRAMSQQKAQMMLIDYIVHLEVPDGMIARFLPAD